MIVNAFLSFVKLLLAAPLALLDLMPVPDVDWTGPTQAVADLPIGSWVGWVNYYVPVTHIFGAIGLILAVVSASFLFNWLVWVLVKLRVLGGGE